MQRGACVAGFGVVGWAQGFGGLKLTPGATGALRRKWVRCGWLAERAVSCGLLYLFDRLVAVGHERKH